MQDSEALTVDEGTQNDSSKDTIVIPSSIKTETDTNANRMPPFVINDSVPILLPPIDKDVKNFVSSNKYEKYCYLTPPKKHSEQILCGISNPLDSLPWLNKCINDLEKFAHSMEQDFLYIFTVMCVNNADICYIYIIVNKSPLWCAPHNINYPPKHEIFWYIFDFYGNLLNNNYCSQRDIDKHFNTNPNIQKSVLVALGFINYNPNYPYPCDI